MRVPLLAWSLSSKLCQWWVSLFFCEQHLSACLKERNLFVQDPKGYHTWFAFKGALSRYSVIFWAIWLWGKRMAAVRLSNEARSTSVLPVDYRSVHCTVYRNIHNCTWKIASLERLSDQDSSRSIRGALQACFGCHEHFTIVQGKLVFLFSLSWS